MKFCCPEEWEYSHYEGQQNCIFTDGSNTNGSLTTQLCDKRDDLNLSIVNFPFIDSMFQNPLHTVQITFIFIGQTRLIFGKRVCTCVTKHSNAFRTFLNWLKNSKRVLHEQFAFVSFRKF